MTLALQIVLALVVLVGLITTIMSIKNWHWAQMLLLLGIFFSSLGTLVLGMEVFRIHRNYRKAIPAKEVQLAEVQADIEALNRGTRDAAVIGRLAGDVADFETLATKADSLAESLTAETSAKFLGKSDVAEGQRLLRLRAQELRNLAKNPALRDKVAKTLEQMAEAGMPSANSWSKDLQNIARQRGRVWRDVAPSGQFDPKTGQVLVNIAQPKPHGLAKDSIVFAFEQGEPNAAAPDKGPRYLGEFRVVETSPDGAQLEPVLRVDVPPGAVPPWFTQLQAATFARVAQSAQKKFPWSLYETMPADRHAMFADLTDEQLKQLLPAASVDEYLRHGKPATDDDDEFHRAGYDEQGRRLGPDDADKAVKTLYDRQLRDYAYLFSDLLRRRAVMTAEHSGLTEDIAKLKAAQANGEKLAAHRTEEKNGLTGDLQHMQRDQQAIEALLAKVNSQLEYAAAQTAEKIRENLRLAAEFAQRQLTLLDGIGSTQAATTP